MHRSPWVGPNRAGRSGVAAVAVVIALVVVALLLFVAIHVAAGAKLDNVRDAWATTMGTFEEVVERHPPTETNAKALEIEGIANRLGVDIAPRYLDDRPRPDDAGKAEFDAVKKQVFFDYLQRMLERPVAGRVDAPPEPLTDYLARHDETLARLRAALASGQPAPVWPSDISKLHSAPIPNLLGHIDLVKLMTSAALERISAGDEATALEYLDASWLLGADLRKSPILINQLIAIAEMRMTLGALRHVESVPEGWRERLEFDHRRAFLQAMKYEGWVWAYMDTGTMLGDSLWDRTTGVVFKPYSTYCLADVSDAWRERIENLERVDSICDYDLSDREADLNIPVPRWNVIGEIVLPNLAGAIRRQARLELDGELTRMAIDARRSWPADGTTPSRACNADTWETTLRDGELRIALSRSIEWTEQIGVMLPTEVVIAPPSAPKP